MDRQEAIERACQIVALVYQTIGDYTQASDGFCHKCPAAMEKPGMDFRHAGKTFDYVLEAVVERLRKDGYTPVEEIITWRPLPSN